MVDRVKLAWYRLAHHMPRLHCISTGHQSLNRIVIFILLFLFISLNLIDIQDMLRFYRYYFLLTILFEFHCVFCELLCFIQFYYFAYEALIVIVSVILFLNNLLSVCVSTSECLKRTGSALHQTCFFLEFLVLFLVILILLFFLGTNSL